MIAASVWIASVNSEDKALAKFMSWLWLLLGFASWVFNR